jgi:hypothetical protein
LAADSVQACGSRFLLSENFSVKEGGVHRKMRGKSGSDDPLSKIQKVSPTVKRHTIMFAPPTTPLVMESIEQGPKVTHKLRLNTRILNLNLSDIVEPNFVMFSMDNIMRMPGNPKGLCGI